MSLTTLVGWFNSLHNQ